MNLSSPGELYIVDMLQQPGFEGFKNCKESQAISLLVHLSWTFNGIGNFKNIAGYNEKLITIKTHSPH